MDAVEADIESFRGAITAAQAPWRETLALVEIAAELKRLNAQIRLEQSVRSGETKS